MNFIRRLASGNNPSSHSGREETADASVSASERSVSHAAASSIERSRVFAPRIVEVTFDAKTDEELIFLWQLAAGEVQSGSGRRDALNAFFDALATNREQWRPVYDEVNASSDVGCARGHPRDVVLAAVADAATLPVRLEELTKVCADPEEQARRRANVGMETFRAIECMARSRHDRALMEQCGLGKALASACKACTQKILAMNPGIGLVGDDTSKEVDAFFQLLQRMIGHIVRILGVYLTEDAGWALRSLNEAGALLCLIETLRVERLLLSKVRNEQREDIMKIEHSAMDAMKCAILGEVTVHKSLASAGGLDIFFEGVYPREVCTEIDESMFTSALMSLDISLLVMDRDLGMIERAQAIGIFLRLATLIRRAQMLSLDNAAANNVQKSLSDSLNEIGEPSPVSADVGPENLLSLILVRLGSVLDRHCATQGDGVLPRSVLSAVIDACTNSFMPFDDESQCLQLRTRVIKFINERMDNGVGIHRVMRQARIWDVLLDSDSFGQLSSAIETSRMDKHIPLYYEVQTRTASLLLRSARCAGEIDDCVDECNVLVGAITARAIEHSSVIRLCRVVQLLLSSDAHYAAKALSEVEAPGRLAGALNAQVKCWGINNVSFTCDDSAPEEAIALGEMLNTLTACLQSSDILAASALNNDGLVDLIFNDLMWQRRTCQFAMNAVTSLLALRIYAPSPHINTLHRDAWSTLARRYIQALPRARATDSELLLKMLKNLRGMLNNTNGSGLVIRDWISKEDGAELVQIVALCDGDAGEPIALEVIATMQAVLHDSPIAVETFSRAVGYDTFLDAIQCARGKDPASFELLDAMMNFVTSARQADDADANTGIALRNPDALRLLCKLLDDESCGGDVRSRFLRSSLELLSTSVTSKATADAAGMLDFLLHWYVTDVTNRAIILGAIHACSSFSISTRHARQMLRLLQSDHILTNDRIELLTLLQRCAKRDGPSTFFDLTGPGCGIHINRQPNLSNRGGYTLSMWLRVEKFPNGGAPMPLFSMLSGTGSGVLAELSSDNLTIGVRGGDGTVDTTTVGVSIKEQEWVMLTISHTPSRMSQPTMRIYLGADMISQIPLRLPTKSSEAMSYCRIATVTFDVSISEQRLKVSPFFGQLGSVHIFQDTLTQPGVALMCAFGAECVGHFKSTELQSDGASSIITSNAVEARELREHLSESRILSISAIDVAGRLTSSSKQDVQTVCDLIGGTKVCVTKSVKDAVHCLGGVQVVLPIFSDIMSCVEDARQHEIVVKGVDLLVALLEGSRLTQVTLSLRDGYGIIAHLLRERPKERMSPELVHALDRLRRAAGAEHESHSARIIVDLHLWSLANDETQDAHGSYLLDLATRHTAGLRTHLTTCDVIDALEYSSGTRGSRRRRVLLDVCYQLMLNASQQVIEETCEAVVQLVEECSDEEIVGDILRWLVNCMQPNDRMYSQLFDAFTKLGGPLLVLAPLQRSAKRVRSFALLWLANLMPPLETESRSRDGLQLSAAFGAAAGALTATLGGKFTSTTSQDFEVGFFTAVASALEQFPEDVAESRSALFELLLGGQALPADKVAEKLRRDKKSSVRVVAEKLFSKASRGQKSGSETAESAGVPGIVNAGAAGVLLRLMSTCDDEEMRLSVLELLLQLVEGAGVNAQAVLEQRGWQTWILPIFGESNNSRNEEQTLARRLISAMLYHAVLHMDDGHKHVSETLGVVDILIKRGVLKDDSDLSQELLSDLLTLILPSSNAEGDEWSEVHGFESPRCRRNLANLIGAFDSILTDTAPDASMLGVPNAPVDATSIKQVSWRFYSTLWNLLDAISPPGHEVEESTSPEDDQKKNVARRIHRRAKSIIRDLPFSGSSENTDDVTSAEKLRVSCQRLGFRLILLYVRIGALEDLESATNTCLGLLPSFLAPAPVDEDGKALDNSSLCNRAHLFLGDLLRFIELQKHSETSDEVRVGIVSNMVRLASEVGRLLLTGCATIEECAHLEGRDLISEQKVAAAAAQEVKESRRLKEHRTKISEDFLSARTNDEKRQKEAEYSLLETRRSKIQPVCERERGRRGIQRLTFEERLDMVANRWFTLIHSLRGSRGVWANSDDASETHWKLDKSADPSMRRARLKRDFKFVQYADNQKGETAPQVDVENTPTVRLTSMAQKWRLTSDKEYTDVDDFSEEFAEKLASDKENAMHNSTKVIFSAPTTLVTLTRAIAGKLNISRDAIVFAADRSVEDIKEGKRFWRWALNEIAQVHHMRYRLQHKAFEIHCTDRSSAFFTFETKKAARFAASRIASASGAVLMNRRAKIEAAEQAKELWRQRRISNFDYLMALNTFAGRTLHDLSQYPVFPWVLKDYHSPTIDLNDSSVYRDLGKPVGALNDERLRTFVERYNALLDDPDTPPFFYGSHYSSSPIVLYFLLRLEPFTKLSRDLQGGRFDRADRLFHSIAETFEACMTSSADVKELIPEFYYSSEFLCNTNQLRLGNRQDGTKIGDVDLPQWANGSRHEFLRVMREALESEHVSRHLHLWIDLIFGSAQKGQEAVEKYNVFYYLTYEGAVDLDNISDEAERKSIETQITNFGQTPTQIFRRSHPMRLERNALDDTISLSTESLQLSTLVASDHVRSGSMSARAAVLVSVHDSRVVTVNGDRSVSSHKLRRVDATADVPPHGCVCTLEPDVDTIHLIDESEVDALATSNVLRLAANAKVLVSVGHWDRSMRLYDVDGGRELQRIVAHRDVTTCLDLCEQAPSKSWDVTPPSSRNVILVTGSRDTTLAIWQIEVPQSGWVFNKATRGLKAEPRNICFGHDETVTCVSVSAQLNIVASGSSDGTLILHDVRDGRIIRSLESTPPGTVPSWIKILSESARIVCACASSGVISVHDINGATISKTSNRHDAFDAIRATRNERHILVGNRQGDITVRATHNLSIIAQINVSNLPITSIETTEHDECALVGFADGCVALWAPQLL